MIFIVFSVCFNRLGTKHTVSNYEIKTLFFYYTIYNDSTKKRPRKYDNYNYQLIQKSLL